MANFDWLALVFCSVMVALAINQELKDVELASIAIQRAGDKMSRSWRIAFMLVNGARRWIFLPTLLVDVPFLVMMKGGEFLRCV